MVNDDVTPDSTFSRWGALFAYAVPVLLLLIFRFLFPANICDDAFITFRTALNLATGNGMVFNPGENIYVVTTPLWVLLLGAARAFSSDIVLAAKLLGALFEALLLINIVHLGYRIMGSRGTGMLAAILVCTNPLFILTSFSGMELSLYLFLICLSLNLLVHERYGWSLIVAALAMWARFDGLLIYFVVLIWILYRQRDELQHNLRKVMLKVLPSFAIISIYFLFGLAYYGDVIPASVQRKMQNNPSLFSTDWMEGAREIFTQFFHAFLGRSVWYSAETPLGLFSIPLVIGLIVIIIRKNQRAVPLIAFTLVYAFVFIGGGNAYAKYFPWYFAPILPGLYLLSAWGLALFVSVIARGSVSFPSFAVQEAVLSVVAILWIFFMFGPLHKDSMHLSNIGREREQVYAAASVWLGKHLHQDTTVAANEIGAIAFFSPSHMTILDMFGILRQKEERTVSYINMIVRHQPEVILTRQIFSYRKHIEKAMENAYDWFTFRTLSIGLRTDLAVILKPHFHELNEIYDTVEIDKEFHWSLNTPDKTSPDMF